MLTKYPGKPSPCSSSPGEAPGDVRIIHLKTPRFLARRGCFLSRARKGGSGWSGIQRTRCFYSTAHFLFPLIATVSVSDTAPQSIFGGVISFSFQSSEILSEFTSLTDITFTTIICSHRKLILKFMLPNKH